jgi:hypothetical protein
MTTELVSDHQLSTLASGLAETIAAQGSTPTRRHHPRTRTTFQRGGSPSLTGPDRARAGAPATRTGMTVADWPDQATTFEGERA